ncbi:MAG: hypothetical protein QXT13_07950 [Pyrobaculum sp.]
MARIHNAMKLYLLNLIRKLEEKGVVYRGASSHFLAAIFEVPPSCFAVDVNEIESKRVVKIDELGVDVEFSEPVATHIVAIFNCADGKRTYILSVDEVEEEEEDEEDEEV